MVLNSFENLGTLISSVGLIQVYLYTRKWFNGFSFLLLALFEVAAMVLTLLDGWLARRQGAEDNTPLVEEDDNDDNVNYNINYCTDDVTS